MTFNFHHLSTTLSSSDCPKGLCRCEIQLIAAYKYQDSFVIMWHKQQKPGHVGQHFSCIPENVTFVIICERLLYVFIKSHFRLIIDKLALDDGTQGFF